MRVCIIGEGISVMTLAKALVNKKIYVDVFTKNKDFKLESSRTLGISKDNTDFINKNVINIKKLIWKLKKIEIFSENLINEKLVNFQDNDKELFSIIKNKDLYKVLEKSLLKNKFFKKKIINNKKLSFIENYKLIINCDNSNIITKKFFNKKIVKRYNSFAYTTIIKHEKILNNSASQIFTKLGPLAFLPISSTQTSVVYSVPNSFQKETKIIEELIRFYNFNYKIDKIDKIDKFKLESLNLRSYYHKNILAFGDLLHRVHPLAGQGFNMTIRDIKVLLNIIVYKKNLGLPLDDSINNEFENYAKHRNSIFLNGIDFIYEFFNFERKTKNNFLSKSVKLISNNPLVGKILTRIADKGL